MKILVINTGSSSIKYQLFDMAVLGSVDAIVFTAGIGENSPLIRELCLKGLEKFGAWIDMEKNRRNNVQISRNDSPVRVFVIPPDEELRIAQETEKLLSQLA